METADESTEVRVTAGPVGPLVLPSRSAADGRPSYAQRLAAKLSADEIAQVEEMFRRQLLNQVVPWRSRTAYVVGKAR